MLFNNRFDRGAGAFVVANFTIGAGAVIDSDPAGGNFLNKPGQPADRAD